MQDKIIFYFIIYSFLGWCLESIYKTIILKKPTNSGFLYGPFCPMYGIGAIILLSLSVISNNIIVVFLLSFFVLSIWEYIVAVIIEKIFKTKYWDYSNLKFNIKGRVCLKNSVYWGILGVILVFLIQPCIEKIGNYIPSQILIVIEIILVIIILVDSIITIIKIMVVDRRIEEIFEIGNIIKEKMQELKEGKHSENVYKEHVQNLIESLKNREEILKLKVYKRIIKLKKSFPEMHSENITKFMKQKNLIEDIKDKIKKYKER